MDPDACPLWNFLDFIGKLSDGWRPGIKEYIATQKFRHKKVSIFYDYNELEGYVNDIISKSKI